MVKPEGRGGIDYPDFIQATTPHENPVEITSAELAIRLGFPQLFERTGNLLHLDTFDTGLGNWVVAGSPVVNKPVLCAPGMLLSPYCAKMTVVNNPGAYGSLSKGLCYPYNTTIGFEFSFLTDGGIGHLLAGLQYFTGTNQYIGWWYYDDTTGKWYIYSTGPAWVEVLEYDLSLAAAQYWHTVKIVYDFVNGQYTRLMIDNEDVGLASYDIYYTADATRPYFLLYMYTYLVGAITCNIYIDNLILTMNEPI